MNHAERFGRSIDAMINRTAQGYSMIGLLISVAIMMVLSVVLLNSLNQAVTGSKSAMPGTIASFKDKEYLRLLFQSMAVSDAVGSNVLMGDANFITPATVAGEGDVSLNTTANLYSAMVMQQYTIPAQLISGNEYNPGVWQDEDYNYGAYDPYERVFWDQTFVADLDLESNVSFAHVPLYRRRLDRYWKFTVDTQTALIGNRGPLDGVDNPSSYTYGRNGQWGGHIVFGDGHVDFFESFFVSGLSYDQDGQTQHDNIFAMETGPNGRDTILSFTKQMTEDGPVLQHD